MQMIRNEFVSWLQQSVSEILCDDEGNMTVDDQRTAKNAAVLKCVVLVRFENFKCFD